MDAPELSDSITASLNALKMMMSDSNNIAFSLDGNMSVAWNNAVQMGWHDVLTAVITDIHKLSGLCSQFESVLSNVMQASSEIDRVDDLWSFISVLVGTPLTNTLAFHIFQSAVQTTVVSYDASLTGEPTEASVTLLVHAYPKTVSAALSSLDFLQFIRNRLESEVAELMLWATRYPGGEIESYPPILAGFRKMGLSIYFTNTHMLDSFADALVSSEAPTS